MHKIIKRAIMSFILLPIVMLFALLFSGLAKGTIYIYIILIFTLIIFICQPFYITAKVNKAKKLLLNNNYSLVIDGITEKQTYIDANGITARIYYVTKINDNSQTVYLSTYR